MSAFMLCANISHISFVTSRAFVKQRTSLDWAINAEENEDDPAKALEWLDQAIYSFEQVDDETLLQKARAHRASLSIRVELQENYADFQITDEMEQQLSDTVFACTSASVLPEVQKLIEAVLPKMNSVTQESFQLDILNKIEDFA